MAPDGGGAYLVNEHFIAYEDFIPVMTELHEIKEKFNYFNMITEVRAIKGDDMPMSNMKGRDTISINFNWIPKVDEAMKVFAPVEAVLNKYNAKPHHAKLTHMDGNRFE